LVTTLPSLYLTLYVLGRRCSSSPSSGVFFIASPHRVRPVDQVANADHEALACGIVAFDAGGVGVAESVVRGVEEPLEHHRVWHAGEIPFRVPVRGRGGQFSVGAMLRLVVSGDEVSGR
jgi:hypothetical protein